MHFIQFFTVDTIFLVSPECSQHTDMETVANGKCHLHAKAKTWSHDVMRAWHTENTFYSDVSFTTNSQCRHTN